MQTAEEYILAKCFHRQADQHNDGSAVCYFIGGATGPIKIGWTRCLAQRMETIQTACPYPLRVLAIAPGGPARERAYHYQFQKYRAHGEWFTRHHALLKEIRRINAGQIEWAKPPPPPVRQLVFRK